MSIWFTSLCSVEKLPLFRNWTRTKYTTQFLRTLLLILTCRFCVYQRKFSISIYLLSGKIQIKTQHNTPTDPFTISEPRDQEIVDFYVVQDRRTTDFEAQKLRKGRSGQTLRAPQMFSECTRSLDLHSFVYEHKNCFASRYYFFFFYCYCCFRPRGQKYKGNNSLLADPLTMFSFFLLLCLL